VYQQGSLNLQQFNRQEGSEVKVQLAVNSLPRKTFVIQLAGMRTNVRDNSLPSVSFTTTAPFMDQSILSVEKVANGLEQMDITLVCPKWYQPAAEWFAMYSPVPHKHGARTYKHHCGTFKAVFKTMPEDVDENMKKYSGKITLPNSDWMNNSSALLGLVGKSGQLHPIFLSEFFKCKYKKPVVVAVYNKTTTNNNNNNNNNVGMGAKFKRMLKIK
jgi:hypothetical protein